MAKQTGKDAAAPKAVKPASWRGPLLILAAIVIVWLVFGAIQQNASAAGAAVARTVAASTVASAPVDAGAMAADTGSTGMVVTVAGSTGVNTGSTGALPGQ